jgi:hypothetical protein
MNPARKPDHHPKFKQPEWDNLWSNLVFQYGPELARQKLYGTDPNTRSDLIAWRYLGRRA